MDRKFTYEEVFLAYKKLKNYYYTDNTSLFIKDRIASFEADIHYDEDFEASLKEKFKSILALLNSSSEKIKQYLLSVIDVRITPKTLSVKKSAILTNRTNTSDIEVERLNYFIDASVEVHLISMLWIMHIGVFLDDFIDKDNYAYKLQIEKDYEEKDKLVNGLRIFKPYYLQYQAWRDNAIKEAERVLKDKKDVVILSLDIKDYFHSVDINFNNLKIDLESRGCRFNDSPKIKKLFNLLITVNKIYSNKLAKYRKNELNNQVLPIGLISSGVLGNYYLKDFDTQVKDQLNPVYYGRYVDDIMIVLTHTTVKHRSISPTNAYLNDYLVKRKLLDFDYLDPNYFLKRSRNNRQKEITTFVDVSMDEIDVDSIEYYEYLMHASKVQFKIRKFENLRIQSSKVMLQDFNYNETPALINKFKKNIEKNRSEFRYLPNEDEIDKEFDEEAFSMHYNDSINKLRSIKEFREDKYGASKYLAAKIFSSSITHDSVDYKKTYRQILTFFKGEIGIEFHTLWEKVATLFVVNNQPEELFNFFNRTRLAINNLRFKDSFKDPTPLDKLKTDLIDFLKISIAIPIAYNLKFNLYKFSKVGKFKEDILEVAFAFRKSNLFRNNWVSIPGLNFTRFSSTNHFSYNLLQKSRSKLNQDLNEVNLEMCPRSIVLSPRYVQFHEVNILQIYRTISSISSTSEGPAVKLANIPNEAFECYWKINNSWKTGDSESTDENIRSYKSLYFQCEESADKSPNFNVTTFSSAKVLDVDKRIALANIKVNPKNIESAFRNKPNTSKNRRDELFKLMNEVEKENADMFILPEVSLPSEWISLLSYQAKRSNMCIISGLEHWVNSSKIAFNLMAVILPINKGPYRTCMINLRLKNHYSPDEAKLLIGNGLIIPSSLPNPEIVYALFHWRGVYFSVYNCFELANIYDRSIFKSKVDFVVASEYNRDVYYFSDIGGSWVRDLHCYFVQVNSSDFGDSRIIQPSSSVTKNILQIKGGENSSIVVGMLPIKKLREFQRKDYYLQKDDGFFKPTPPDFNVLNVSLRIENKDFKDQ